MKLRSLFSIWPQIDVFKWTPGMVGLALVAWHAYMTLLLQFIRKECSYDVVVVPSKVGSIKVRVPE